MIQARGSESHALSLFVPVYLLCVQRLTFFVKFWKDMMHLCTEFWNFFAQLCLVVQMVVGRRRRCLCLFLLCMLCPPCGAAPWGLVGVWSQGSYWIMDGGEEGMRAGLRGTYTQLPMPPPPDPSPPPPLFPIIPNISRSPFKPPSSILSFPSGVLLCLNSLHPRVAWGWTRVTGDVSLTLPSADSLLCYFFFSLVILCSYLLLPLSLTFSPPWFFTGTFKLTELKIVNKCEEK